MNLIRILRFCVLLVTKSEPATLMILTSTSSVRAESKTTRDNQIELQIVPFQRNQAYK